MGGEANNEQTGNEETTRDTIEKRELLEAIQDIKGGIKDSEIDTHFGGYIEVEAYNTYKSRLNLIAKAIGSKQEFVKENSKQVLTNMVTSLKEEVGALSAKEAQDAQEKLNDSQYIYKYIFMFDIHFALEDIDIRREHNAFNRFISNSLGTDGMNEDAELVMQDLNDFTLAYFAAIENNVDYFGGNFSKKNLSILQTVLEKINLSVDRQLLMLENLNRNYSETTEEGTQQLENIIVPVNEASEALGKIEKKLDVQDFDPDADYAN